MVSFIPGKQRIRSASLKVNLYLFVFLVISAEASRYFTLEGHALSVIWPPAGIFLAAVLVFGTRVLPVLILAMIFWSQVFQSATLTLSLFFSLGLAIGSWLGAKAMQPTAIDLSSTSQLLRLYLGGVLLASGISSLFGSLGIFLTGELAPFNFIDIWMVYWGFEGFGVMLFTPIAVLLLLDRKDLFQRIQSDLARLELKLWLMLSLMMASLSVLLSLQGQSLYATLITYSFFPLLCWLVFSATRATLFALLPVFAMAFVIFALRGWADVQLINSFDGLVKLLLQLASVILMAHLVATLTFERNRLLDGFKRQAVRDHLTGLQNDRGLNAFLQKTIEQQSMHDYRLVQLEILDFDDLRLRVGFDAACDIERALAKRLQILDSIQLSRLSAGSYIWLMSYKTELFDQEIEALYTSLNETFIEGSELQQPIQVAIASIPFELKLDSPMKCLTALSQAVAVARRLPRRVWQEPNAVRLIEQREALIDQFDRLKKAVRQGNLKLYAQAIRSLRHPEEGLMFEVLIRFQGDGDDVIAPAPLLNVAKTFGYMPVVDFWVIEETFKYLAEQAEQFSLVKRCSINLSGQTLVSAGLLEHIERCFRDYSVDRHKICFEITETEVIEDEEIATNAISALRAMGCKIALDDFGTGLASFEYLYRYSFDYLKIDGRFVRNILTHPVDQITVKSIAEIASAMGLETVAEFVESETMVTMLADFGVTYAQGYGIAHPEPLSQFLK